MSARRGLSVALVSILVAAALSSSGPAAAEPSLRQRVLANIARSRQARQASKFGRFAARERAGFPRRARRGNRHSRGLTRGPNTVPHDFVVHENRVQPAVVFDKSDRHLKRYVLRKAAKLRMNNKKRPWAKIERIQKVIRQKVKHAGNELSVDKNPNRYNRFNHRRRSRNQLASLGDYLRRRTVVCREFAFITQAALEVAGFESRLVRGDITRNGERVGGHAWNEIKLDGKWYIVDTTNPRFNKVEPQVAATTGTSNGWIWKRSTYGPTISPVASWRRNH